jgi:hypothetical protein
MHIVGQLTCPSTPQFRTFAVAYMTQGLTRSRVCDCRLCRVIVLICKRTKRSSPSPSDIDYDSVSKIFSPHPPLPFYLFIYCIFFRSFSNSLSHVVLPSLSYIALFVVSIPFGRFNPLSGTPSHSSGDSVRPLGFSARFTRSGLRTDSPDPWK